jgi:hypothetical protein
MSTGDKSFKVMVAKLQNWLIQSLICAVGEDLLQQEKDMY